MLRCRICFRRHDFVGVEANEKAEASQFCMHSIYARNCIQLVSGPNPRTIAQLQWDGNQLYVWVINHSLWCTWDYVKLTPHVCWLKSLWCVVKFNLCCWIKLAPQLFVASIPLSHVGTSLARLNPMKYRNCWWSISLYAHCLRSFDIAMENRH